MGASFIELAPNGASPFCTEPFFFGSFGGVGYLVASTSGKAIGMPEPEQAAQLAMYLDQNRFIWRIS
jgi:hypothetical protein